MAYVSTQSGSTEKRFNPRLFEEKIEEYSQKALYQFKKTIRFYSIFHICSGAFVVTEIFCILLFFSFLSKSYFMALSIASLVLTAFAYLVLLFYFQAKKPQQFIELQGVFTSNCQEVIPFEKGSPEFHLSLAEALFTFIGKLENLEYHYLKINRLKENYTLLIQKLTAWLYWKDIHKMKELLLYVCIDEHIQLVKSEPTDLEAHASLANAYVALSKLYLDPRKKDPNFHFPWVSHEFNKEEMKEKFNFAAQRAIEEFKILDDYIPNDPWVHAQLACVFHDLEMTKEEISEYEKMIEISPDDRHVMFRLGVLYFGEGLNAKGLRIYQKLKLAKDSMAEELISFYGSCTFQ